MLSAIKNILATGSVAAILLGIALWLARTWISTRLTASIQLETEQLLERFRAELREAESRAAAVSAAGIGAIAQMANATFPVRVASAQKVWDACLRWRSASAVTQIVSILDIAYVQSHGDHPGTKETFKKMLDSIKYLELMSDTNSAESARPFVSERAWALFFAYHSLMVSRMTKAAMLSISGSKAAELWKRVDERALIAQSATPEIVASYDENVFLGSTRYITYVQDELVAELRRTLSGAHAAPEASQFAANVVKSAGQLLQATASAPKLPTVD